MNKSERIKFAEFNINEWKNEAKNKEEFKKILKDKIKELEKDIETRTKDNEKNKDELNTIKFNKTLISNTKDEIEVYKSALTEEDPNGGKRYRKKTRKSKKTRRSTKRH